MCGLKQDGVRGILTGVERQSIGVGNGPSVLDPRFDLSESVLAHRGTARDPADVSLGSARLADHSPRAIPPTKSTRASSGKLADRRLPFAKRPPTKNRSARSSRLGLQLNPEHRRLGLFALQDVSFSIPILCVVRGPLCPDFLSLKPAVRHARRHALASPTVHGSKMNDGPTPGPLLHRHQRELHDFGMETPVRAALTF